MVIKVQLNVHYGNKYLYFNRRAHFVLTLKVTFIFTYVKLLCLGRKNNQTKQTFIFFAIFELDVFI